jgi:predicted dinucleotide-binding enzyme
MRIAVIRMGNVGSLLRRRWADTGHEVSFCVRNPENAKKRVRRRK